MMAEDTLQALKKSILKWQRIYHGTARDNGSDDCALCHLFLSRDLGCKGCPVKEKTGESFCNESPYVAYQDNPSKEMAKLELDFLISLLPEGETPLATIHPKLGHD